MPIEVDKLLNSYKEVFQSLEVITPKRQQDHAIHLWEGASIPNLRPYKYPHQQKNEIEKLISEMLKANIIRPSINLHPSPIILVRKKDGGSRFCVDYRALNKLTIPNKFPILVIEELLDELARTTIFSKLDLKSTFQFLMNVVLKPFLKKFVLAFFDDMLIYSPSLDMHLQHLSQVLQ